MRYCFLPILLLFYCISFSQSKIDGILKTEDNNPIITGVNVTITELDSDEIINYYISNHEGYFSIELSSNSEKLLLKVQSMGYKPIVRVIDNKPQTIEVFLVEQITKLKEIVLKSNPITQKGDTLNYSVNAFSKQEHRTIADVLKNMPGIEVLNDGRILYQGKPINKFYIEGLDLLDGKYNLASNNLPHKEVTQVQVLENHQPIKILDSLVYSDQAAINIKLKNNYTFTGQAKLGLGFSDLLWDMNLTPMLFSKKRQMLSSYQTNNTGNNVALQLKTLTIEELLEQFERNDEKQDWLAIQQLEIPNFTEQRWLNNNIHLLTTNYLQKLKNDYELRLNVSYLNDYQQSDGFTNTQFFTINDTIALFENKYNQLYTNTLETDITLQKNINKNFLKNTIKFQGFWDGEQGIIQLNDDNINQNLSNRNFKLSNNLKTLFPIGKQIAILKSYIGLNKTPQSLIVSPGQFNNLLNNSDNFDEITQNIELNTFYTNNSLGFTKGWKQFSFNSNLGFQFEKQSLESEIITANTKQASNFENNLDWTRSKLYFEMKTQYRKEKWRIELTTPISLNNYKLKDEPLQRSQNLNRITFEPRLSLNYEINNFWRIGSSTSLSNQFGTINKVYYNYILQNYRRIQRIDAPLPEMQNLSYSASVVYRNPIESLFFNLIYNNIIIDNNLLYSNQLLDNGAIELQAIEHANKKYSHNLSSSVSKYFSDINSNLTLSADFNLQDFEQILNTEVTSIANQNWRTYGKINTDIIDWLNTELESTFLFSKNKIQKRENRTIIQQSHKFRVNIYPKENHYVGIKNEYIKNNLFSKNTKNIFSDLLYRYSWKKKNIDFEVQWNNIFNTQNYRTMNIDNFSYLESSLTLRPVQVLFMVRFSL